MSRLVHAATVVAFTISTVAACTPQLHRRSPAPDPPPGPVVVNGSRWDQIAWCESGGQWNHRPVTNRHGTFSGGLMIWTKAWVAYGGQQFAPQAWLASRADQITVAERILADRGWRAWDCA